VAASQAAGNVARRSLCPTPPASRCTRTWRVGGDGTIAVAWNYESPVVNPPAIRKIQVAVRPAGSKSWSSYTLAQCPLGGVSVTNFVRVRMDNAGNITAAWTIWDESHNVIQAASMSKGGAWSAVTSLSTSGADGFAPSLWVNARGDAGIVYVLTPYPDYNMPHVAQYVSRLGPARGPPR